jgi:hypothetical protein
MVGQGGVDEKGGPSLPGKAEQPPAKAAEGHPGQDEEEPGQGQQDQLPVERQAPGAPEGDHRFDDDQIDPDEPFGQPREVCDSAPALDEDPQQEGSDDEALKKDKPGNDAHGHRVLMPPTGQRPLPRKRPSLGEG